MKVGLKLMGISKHQGLFKTEVQLGLITFNQIRGLIKIYSFAKEFEKLGAFGGDTEFPRE